MTAGVVNPWKGSAGTSVQASTMQAKTPANVSNGSSKKARNGTNHAAYHGSRYGRDNASRNTAIPHSAIGARASASRVRRTSRQKRRANSRRNAVSTPTRTSHDPPRVCATKCEGLAQDSIPPKLANDAKGWDAEKKVSAVAIVSATIARS